MITTAVERNGSVYVYGQNGQLLTTLSGSLCGFTSANVSVKRGNTIYVYNEHGAMISSHSV